ncbi:MAG: hypothetical protein KKB51_04210 [Candidatus Riflebacteria bacterium]|nr:hypothetical protein [Candidatus Riflebacteria bacterium]
MHVKIILTAVLLGLLITCAGWANPDYKEIIAKYGPVPDAILDPPVDEAIAMGKDSLLNRFFGSGRSYRPQARTKACYANQRVSLGAIEMYNMDHETMYLTLIHSDLAAPSGMMVTGGYLKSPLTMPEPGCHLRSYGNLAEYGVIYCDYHGTLTDEQQQLRDACGYTPKPRRNAANDNSMLAVFVMLAVFSVGVMIVLHKVLPKAPK